MCEFRTDKIIQKCKKARPCTWCSQEIPVGAQYASVAGKSDGDFWTGRFHPECYRAERQYWKSPNVDYDEGWPDEAMPRGQYDDIESPQSSDPLRLEGCRIV